MTSEPRPRLPVAEPDLSGNEGAYVADAIRSTWISSTGPYIERFEREFAQACGAGAAVGVSNGTVALHLAMLALGIGPGDEVLVPSLTYIATANAVRYVGAEPVFVDVDPKTWCIDAEDLEARITRRSRAVIAVHLYGHPADMDAINRVAAIHGLSVVEDAAEAHFARYKGRTVGSLAPLATFSFYGNKIITSGEGGAVTVSDPSLETRLRTLRGQGVDPNRRYYFPVTGYNFRITNVACALLCAQMERSDTIRAARRRVFEAYAERLTGIPGLTLQPVASWAEPAHWMFCIRIDAGEFGVSRDELIRLLDAEGIDTRPFFVPVHRLPPYREESRARNEELPVTDALSSEGLNLPSSSTLSDSDTDRVVEAVRAAAR